MGPLRYFDSQGAAYSPSRGLRRLFIGKERRAVLAVLEPKKGEMILDAGCGNGFYTKLIEESGAHAYGVDSSPSMIAELRGRGLRGRVADLLTLDLGRTFDKVLCSGALEFIPEPARALKRMLVHLNPGGKLVVLAPRSSIGGIAYATFHRLHGVRVHLFSRRAFMAMLEGSGAEVGRCVNAHSIALVIEISKRPRPPPLL